MQSLIAGLNGLANRLFDAGLSLPGVLGPSAETAAVALLLGAVTAAVFHRFADSSALRESRRELGAILLEIWLYRHDPVLVLRAEGRLLRANVRYLRDLFPPLVLCAALAAPVLVQAWHRFGLEPAVPGADILLTAELKAEAGDPAWPQLAWEAGRGEITAVVRQPSVHRIVWRLRPLEPGVHTLHLAGPTGVEAFPLFAGAVRSSIAATRESSLWGLLVHPRGQPLPEGSGLRRIWVEYPRSGAQPLIWPGVLSLAAALVAYRLLARLRDPRQ
ncbi:MAG: hypothetical protein OXG13_08545 [Gemmatimonadaceae bacterium]|nr:hypothetical protein [Gemmatimonadaceae bacterium]